MTRAPAPSSLDAAERRRVEHNLDRIEDRLRDAPDGLHHVGPPATRAALERSPLSPAMRRLWATWDGLDLGHGELRLFSLAEIEARTAEARDDGRARADDLAIGERGADLLVLAGDPHAEGADVVLVEEDGTRLPHSSCVDLLVVAALGEAAVLFDDEGEYQPDLFDAHGELSRAAERRLLRRHLDLDPDAPLARFRLARVLRRAGELRAAAGELRQLLRRTPEFAWAHHELGRVRLGLGEADEAARAFVRAARLADAGDPELAAYFFAWTLLALGPGPSGQEPSDSPKDVPPRAALAAEVLARSPGFVAAQEAGVRAALEAEDPARADEMLRLGLAVTPGHLGLLGLRPTVAAALAALPAAPTPSDPALEGAEEDREIAAADAAAAADDDLADPDARRRREPARPSKPHAGGTRGAQPGRGPTNGRRAPAAKPGARPSGSTTRRDPAPKAGAGGSRGAKAPTRGPAKPSGRPQREDAGDAKTREPPDRGRRRRT
jgi:tetratricopeptide (TPR) repeat protein